MICMAGVGTSGWHRWEMDCVNFCGKGQKAVKKLQSGKKAEIRKSGKNGKRADFVVCWNMKVG